MHIKHFLAKHATIKHRFYSLYCTLYSYIRGFIILALALWIGNLISAILPITIPGSIIGLLLLFFLMVFQLIPSRWINHSCNLFMRYMTLLFIPAAMGIMDNYVLLLQNWAPIIISCIISSIFVLIFTAFFTEHLFGSSSPLSQNRPSFEDIESEGGLKDIPIDDNVPFTDLDAKQSTLTDSSKKEETL